MRYVVGRDAQGRVVDVPISGNSGTVDDGTADHPDLTEHVSLGLAAEGHSHAAGDHPDLAAHTTLGLAAMHAHDYSATGHTHTYAAQSHAHAEADVTNLVTDLTGKSSTSHNHDVAYSAASHSHLDADIPVAIARDAEVTSAIATHAATPHGGASEAFPVGAVFLSVVTTSPATLLGYGTWAAFGAGRMLVGFDAGQAGFDTDEETGGAATHGHTFTQPDAHAALTHAGATVGAHAFTQPGAHTDHAAQAHSAHAGATVGAHTFTQPSAHSAHVVTQPSAHADVLNHVHTQNINTATTGAAAGFPALVDTSTSGSSALGLTTSNPTANGVASQAHTGTAVDAHSAHAGGAVDAHTVGQASAHSDHAALSHSAHSGGAVDAHSVGQANQHAVQSHANGAVADGSTLPPYITVHMWKRTA